MQIVLSLISIKNIKCLNKSLLTFKNNNGEIYFDVDQHFRQKLYL